MGYPHASLVALPLVFASLMLLVVANALASADNVSNALQTNQPATIHLTLSKQANTAIRLEARVAPLGKILKAIADKTGVNIHYSVLPEAPVTATCVGANVGQVMDCLVAKQVGLVAHKPQKDKPAEFWLLGSSVGSCQAVTVLPIEAVRQSVSDLSKEQLNEAVQLHYQRELNSLLDKAKNGQPDERNLALVELSTKEDETKKGEIDALLREGLSNEDPDVRGQVLYGLTSRGGSETYEILEDSLKDESVGVRVSAINALNAGETQGVNLLKEALTDEDETVRSLAAGKLKEIGIEAISY